MKICFCLFFAALIAASMAQSLQEQVYRFSEECKRLVGLSDGSVGYILRTTGDPRTQAYVSCILGRAANS
ncbi:hypothetical protein Zmor_027246 [Zophobas morio]|uniref:Uncharacterized protein n=1 Tax=Zophobas morio TaxID=2755281 RepID=A0AA38M2E3_9CUCU|nr:hypothetical protein Zmor_027246 [Zophobas morio]